jgi:hypothetical protein
MTGQRRESSWKPIVNAVAAYHHYNGYGPTVNEIALRCGAIKNRRQVSVRQAD